ncbi:hypothetical protein [Actinoplanes sp. NPDC048796]
MHELHVLDLSVEDVTEGFQKEDTDLGSETWCEASAGGGGNAWCDCSRNE